MMVDWSDDKTDYSSVDELDYQMEFLRVEKLVRGLVHGTVDYWAMKLDG